MSNTTIQRQSILSTIIILAGFGFGALNILFLQKMVLTREQWGLTRVVAEGALLMSGFATLGLPMVTGKFLPFYKHYLPGQKPDLPYHAMRLAIGGLALVLAFLLLFKPAIVQVLGRNNPFFPPYYYALVLFTAFQSVFGFMEVYAWFAGRAVAASAFKELVFRLLTTICLLLLWVGVISFDGFVALFALTYLPCAVGLIWVVARAKGFQWQRSVSHVTRRLWRKMVSYGSFILLAQVSNVAFLVCDTLFLASLYNFSQAGVYAVAQYFGQTIEVPFRSMQSPAVPLVSTYWREKNFDGLLSIYRKSCINLLIAGMAIGGFILINLPNIGRFYGPDFQPMLLPLAILVLARWINLGTGLNTLILQLSTRWRLDFYSTFIYSLIGIPLNYWLISSYGMVGAATANVIAMTLYNAVRFWFLYHYYGLQPFTWRIPVLLLTGSALIGAIYLLPASSSLWIDGLWRSSLFAVSFAVLVLVGGFSQELTNMYHHWSRRLLRRA